MKSDYTASFMSVRMNRRAFLSSTLAAGLAIGGRAHGGLLDKPHPVPIRGRLRPHKSNGRYFTNDTGRAVYLTGSHLGWELQDNAWDKPVTFDFPGYLDLLSRHGHNLIRMWSVEHTRTDKSTTGVLASPMPFVRTGPGAALDGQPRFDLQQFDERYFRRLRERVQSAAKLGIYVMPVLFQGWSHRISKKHRNHPWFGNVYHKANNINGIDGARGGDPRLSHSLGNAPLLAVQEAYVRKVMATLNDLDNVLYEVSNESLGSIEWHEHMVRFIHRLETRAGPCHPVMLSGCGGGLTNAQLLTSPAEVVGLSGIGDRNYLNNPPAADGTKIVIHDTDHIKPDYRQPDFVWKNLLRGNHPIVLDWDLTDRKDREWEPIRRAMGLSRALSDNLDLAATSPVARLASSGYCLADRGTTCLSYQPGGGGLDLDLREFPGQYGVAWWELPNARPRTSTPVSGGVRTTIELDSKRDCLVHLKRLA
jgi:hypothetical protein